MKRGREQASEASSLRIATGSRLRALLALAALPVAMGGCGGSSETVSSGTKPLDTVTSTQQSVPAAPKKKTIPSHTGTPSGIVSKDPKKAIEGAIEGVLAPQTPGLAVYIACGFYVTDRYLKTTYGGRRGCVQAQIPGSAADSVKVSNILLDGDRATARAIPRGGPSSGETITVHLVRYRSYWKVDSLRSNAPVGP